MTVCNNFEVASFALFRSPLYASYFEALDRSGGFYYERWGDAPVHTYFALLTLEQRQIYRFRDIGYVHEPLATMPESAEARRRCGRKPLPFLGFHELYLFLNPSRCNALWDKLFAED